MQIIYTKIAFVCQVKELAVTKVTNCRSQLGNVRIGKLAEEQTLVVCKYTLLQMLQ